MPLKKRDVQAEALAQVTADAQLGRAVRELVNGGGKKRSTASRRAAALKAHETRKANKAAAAKAATKAIAKAKVKRNPLADTPAEM